MVWRHEKLVQEDLNVGTGMVWITSPGSGELRSTQLGLHSFARGQQEYTKTWAPGAIATTSNASTTITVPDAVVGDFVLASHDKLVTNALRIMGHVSAAGTVTVVIHNPTTASVTPASGTLSVLVFPTLSSASPGTFTVTWVVVESEAGVSGESYDYTFTPTIVGGTAPYTYSWDFSDGSPDTNETPTQVWTRSTWTNPDDITVTLTVTDDTLATAVYSADVTVTFNE